MMPSALRLFFITGLAMTAFAANSVLARLAMAGGEAGPWAFTLLRILSGALVLALIVSPGRAVRAGSWASAAALLAYAAFFSLAYLSLTTGTGALILFALVQITMIGWGLAIGERLSAARWAGMALAVGGLVWLLMPGLQAPPLTGALLMAVAGIGWGIYSLAGRKAEVALVSTAANFVLATGLGLVVLLGLQLSGSVGPWSLGAVVLAVVSGAVTSGLGYALWYAVLPRLPGSVAAVAQLTVPVIAMAGGMVFLGEALTARFALAALLVLGGVAVSVVPLRRG